MIHRSRKIAIRLFPASAIPWRSRLASCRSNQTGLVTPLTESRPNEYTEAPTVFDFSRGSSRYDSVLEIARRRKRMELPAFRIVLCALVLSLPHALAQDKPKPYGEAAVIAARPEDVSSIEAIVKADYECVSGGIGVARQWARDFSLYDPFARSFVPSKDEKTGARSFGTRRNRNTRTNPMRSLCATGSVNMRSPTRFTSSGMWRQSLAVMKYRWQGQENSIRVVSTSTSFTTLRTGGGFPRCLGMPRTTLIRFLRS